MSLLPLFVLSINKNYNIGLLNIFFLIISFLTMCIFVLIGPLIEFTSLIILSLMNLVFLWLWALSLMFLLTHLLLLLFHLLLFLCVFSPSHASSNTLHSTHHSSFVSLFWSLIQHVVLDFRMHPLPPTINSHPMLTCAQDGVFGPKTYQAMLPLSCLLFNNLSRIFIGKKLWELIMMPRRRMIHGH